MPRMTYLALSVLLMMYSATAQTHQWAGASGGNPLCARLSVPRLIGDDLVYPVGNGVAAPVSAPALVKKTEPVIPPDKRSFKGTVIVCAIVSPDGRVHTAGIGRAAGNGLDEIALDTVKQWEFKPGMIGNKAVATQMSLVIKFGD